MALKSADLYMIKMIKSTYLQSCVIVITKILRLFENSQSLGKFFAELGEKQNSESRDPSENNHSNTDDIMMRLGQMSPDDDEYYEEDDSLDYDAESNDDLESIEDEMHSDSGHSDSYGSDENRGGEAIANIMSYNGQIQMSD
jgi:hypothetical protein